MIQTVHKSGDSRYDAATLGPHGSSAGALSSKIIHQGTLEVDLPLSTSTLLLVPISNPIVDHSTGIAPCRRYSPPAHERREAYWPPNYASPSLKYGWRPDPDQPLICGVESQLSGHLRNGLCSTTWTKQDWKAAKSSKPAWKKYA